MNTCYPCSIGKHMACLYKSHSLTFSDCDCDTCSQIYADAQNALLEADYYDEWRAFEDEPF